MHRALHNLRGREWHTQTTKQESYSLEMCEMAALILLDQINKHHTLLSFERENFSFLLLGHYSLEKSSESI
jgi:hypothetical protein